MRIEGISQSYDVYDSILYRDMDFIDVVLKNGHDIFDGKHNTHDHTHGEGKDGHSHGPDNHGNRRELVKIGIEPMDFIEASEIGD